MRKMVSVLFCVVIAGCVGQQPAPEKIHIAVTILPQAEFVEKIGGDTVQVLVMVPPGASPHTYELTPTQLTDVSKARLYVKVGSGVEVELAWMDRIFEMNKSMVVVDCSQGIELIRMDEHEHEHENGYDPHIWLSPKNAMTMVETIYNGLVQINPSQKEYYTKNKNAYITELKTLDKDIASALSSMTLRKILVYHPSWTYFCRDYGLEQLPVERKGKEPTPHSMAQLITEANQYGITVIFASPQVSTHSADVIAQEIGGKVVLLDPLAKEYIANMQKVVQAFTEGVHGCC